MWVKYALIGLGLAHVVFGVYGLYAPLSVAEWLSLQPLTAGAMGELRAVFGGFVLALGAILLRGATGGSRARQWLMAAALGYAGLALGRILSLAADGVTFHTLASLLLEAGLGAFIVYSVGVLSGAEGVIKERPTREEAKASGPATDKPGGTDGG